MNRLTAREQQVLYELCQGNSQKIVADKLDIKPETVKFHVKNILTKLDASNIAQAAYVAGKGEIDI